LASLNDLINLIITLKINLHTLHVNLAHSLYTYNLYILKQFLKFINYLISA
jgi:hypothetical protein